MRDQVPPALHDRIAHTRIALGDQMLMASDSPSGCHADSKGMTVSLVVNTPAEAERIYRDMSAGGTVTMPNAETFWAYCFGMFTDRFGIPWMINCERAELKAA